MMMMLMPFQHLRRHHLSHPTPEHAPRPSLAQRDDRKQHRRVHPVAANARAPTRGATSSASLSLRMKKQSPLCDDRRRIDLHQNVLVDEPIERHTDGDDAGGD
jgi:hypothetical protein